MDGTSRTVLHSTGLTFPSGITLDYTSQTLYWIDAIGLRIESSDVDGSNRQIVTTSSIIDHGELYTTLEIFIGQIGMTPETIYMYHLQDFLLQESSILSSH